jgi:hypothetical protein
VTLISIEKLANEFSEHTKKCESAPFVCSVAASFESWFHVELVPVLQTYFNYPLTSIETNFNYPNTTRKADLCVRDVSGPIVFEFKQFVTGADQNKLKEYPSQLNRLEKLITESNVEQVIAVTTFMGYSQFVMNKLVARLFETKWTTIGPRALVERYPLQITFSTIVK